MIDIEKLAKEHEVDCVGDYGGVFDVPLDKLQKFAEAYHKAMCEVEASSTGVATQPLKRLSDEQISEIAYKVHEGISPHNDTMNFANAIMDEMERINK